MKKRLFALALAGVLAAATLTGCGSLKGDETVATVDDTKIDADLANFFARYTQATYETYYSDGQRNVHFFYYIFFFLVKQSFYTN